MNKKLRIQTYKIKIQTPAGEFYVDVMRKHLARISGTTLLGTKEFPFTVTLQKIENLWQPAEQPAEIDLDQFLAHVVNEFASWAEKHPNIFEFAELIYKDTV